VRVVNFDIGNLRRAFPFTLHLISKKQVQIRDNAIESGRAQSNRVLEGALGKNGFHMKIRMHPHHILRENPLAAGAGADRMSTGMKASFGKVIGNACQVKQGKILVSVSVRKSGLEIAREALRKYSSKLPTTCTVQVVENKID
jgi:large subunit ribosomal protein L10e